MTIQELDFLRESNNIEDEWDDKALQDAIMAWQYVRHHMSLSARNILTVHSVLMEHRDTIDDKDKGKFRDGAVWIGGKEAKPFYVVESLIADWLERLNQHVHDYQDTQSTDALLEKQAQEFHVQYEGIHPFFDGNGRTGRIFYNWHRKRLGLPIHVIHVGKEQYEYYKWFR